MGMRAPEPISKEVVKKICELSKKSGKPISDIRDCRVKINTDYDMLTGFGIGWLLGGW